MRICSDGDATASPGGAQYRFAGIEHLIAGLEADDRAWRDWFAQAGLQPLVITYEELDRTPQETVARVLDTLGLANVEVPAPGLRRQRDEHSADWAQRFRVERERDRAAGASAGPISRSCAPLRQRRSS